MNYDPQKYAQLLVNAIPGVIADDQEYGRIEAIFDSLINKGEDKLSPEEGRLFELLANLLEDYERKALTPLELSTPAETLQFLVNENGLKQSDLEDVFGSQAVVSKVLNGQRSISKAQARRLADRFRMSTDAFI